MAVDLLEVAAGVLLLFVLPGFTLTKAVFPEWRVRGPAAMLRALELGTLSFVGSVACTILVGYVLLTGFPAGFATNWSDPWLEAGLAGIAAVGFLVGLGRGAYARTPPVTSAPEPPEESPWELSRTLDGIERELRSLRRRRREVGAGTPEGSEVQARMDELERRRAVLQHAAEADHER